MGRLRAIKNLSPEAEKLIELARDLERPTDIQQRRAWAALVRRLGLAWFFARSRAELPQ